MSGDGYPCCDHCLHDEPDYDPAVWRHDEPCQHGCNDPGDAGAGSLCAVCGGPIHKWPGESEWLHLAVGPDAEQRAGRLDDDHTASSARTEDSTDG